MQLKHNTPSIWSPPLKGVFGLTHNSMSFKEALKDTIEVPLAPHPGAFAVQRKNHTHEGVDLYAPEGTPVYAVEDGIVVAVLPFTGPGANLPWWLDTDIVLIEGASGVVAYGEINPMVQVNTNIPAGTCLGAIKRVLRHDKGRPTSMLHLELHTHGTRGCPEWTDLTGRPSTLLDPTHYLLSLIKKQQA